MFNTELLKIIIAALSMFTVIEGAKMPFSLSGLIGLVVYVLVGGTISIYTIGVKSYQYSRNKSNIEDIKNKLI